MEKIAVKCGLEIHQQLEGRKLFCNCPTTLQDDEPTVKIRRKLRAVAGEAGEVDIAAQREVEKGKWFEYEGYESTCLVELDESPPCALNSEALHTALQFAKLVGATPVDCLQMMRKTVVDGSNTSGFQRTGVVALGGKISGNVNVATVAIEEDACRIIKSEPGKVVYRLDRLGIPLIEIATEPDITSAEQAAEVAEEIGLLLRSTGKAKRGLGTIRQDVNVSIAGGTRVEIKGAQDLKILPTLVTYEAQRQKSLLDLRDELNKRTSGVDAPVEMTAHFADSKSAIISKAVKSGGNVFGLRLKGFAGLVGKEVQPKRRLGTELSDRAKAYAGVGGLFHSDELPNYGITEDEVASARKHLKCKEQDAFILVADERGKCIRAMKAIADRAAEALQGVPKEVRKANEDGTTSFLRPMPGAARMYPETDIPIIPITDSYWNSIPVPETIQEKEKRYEKLGLGKDLASLAARSEDSGLVEDAVKKLPSLNPGYIAEIILTGAKTVKRQFNIEIKPTAEDFRQLLDAVANGKISKESVLEVLKENKPVSEVIEKYKVLGDKELKKAIERIVGENKGLQFNALIGKAMQELRGKAPGQRIVSLLKELTS